MKVHIIAASIFLIASSCSTTHKKENLSLCKKGWDVVRSQPQEAINLFNQCLKRGNLSSSSTARTYRNIGISYNRMHKYEKAIEYFDRAILLKPKDVFHDYVNKGNSYDLLGRSDKAIEHYNKAIQENKICATSEIKKGNHVKIVISNSCGEIYYNRGVYYEGQKDYKKAIEDFKTAYKFGLRTSLLFRRFVVHKINPKTVK